MIEAKEKGNYTGRPFLLQRGLLDVYLEQAVFQLYKLYALHPVDDDVWIPDPNGSQPKQKRVAKRKAASKDTEIEAAIMESEAVKEEEVNIEIDCNVVGIRTRGQRRLQAQLASDLSQKPKRKKT